MFHSHFAFFAVPVLLTLSACSHAPESRPENRDDGREPASAEAWVSSEDSHDEFYKSLSAYRDGIAVSGYARVYSDHVLKEIPEQEVAQPFSYYIALSSDFEFFVDGPDNLKCDQHSDPGPFGDFKMEPVIHASPERTVQLFSII